MRPSLRFALRFVIVFAVVGGGLAQRAEAQSPLTCGQVAVGTISTPGERDRFTFFGEQGDVITFTIVEVGEVEQGFIVSGAVYAPSTMPGFTFRTLIAGTQNVTRLPETGTYSVDMFDYIGANRGTYALRIGWLLPSSKQCGDRATVSCGQAVSGAIATPLEHDIFMFSGQQGQSVMLTLTQTAGFTQGLPFGERLSPSGAYLGTLTPSFPAVATLAETGNYVVAIHDNINKGVSTYTLRLDSDVPCLPVPPPATPSNLTATVVGSTVTLNWSPSGTGGTVTSYVLEAGFTPGASNVVIFDTGSAATSLTASGVPSGVYYVRVRARNASGTSAASNEIVVVM
jgi:hypothetical protein